MPSAGCALHVHDATLTLPLSRDPDARLFIYGTHNMSCACAFQGARSNCRAPWNMQQLSCAVELHLKSANLTIECPLNEARTLDEHFPGVHSSAPFSVICNAPHAAFMMHKHRDELLAANAVLHYGKARYSTPLEGRHASHRVRVCTKAYGDGGRIGDEAYLEWWMARWRALGVADVVVYVLDTTVPRSLASFRTRHPHGRELTIRHWPPVQPYTPEVYSSQSETAAAEIEVSYRTAMAHCSTDARGRVDWVLEVDNDELVVLGPQSRPGMSLGQAAIGALPPPGDLYFAAFSMPVQPTGRSNASSELEAFQFGKPWEAQPHAWKIALDASNNHTRRFQHMQDHGPETGWKPMFRPTAEPFVSAHGFWINDEDESQNHLVHVETAFLVHHRGGPPVSRRARASRRRLQAVARSGLSGYL